LHSNHDIVHLFPGAIMAHELTLQNYEAAVSIAMMRRYGITWEDACGDPEPLTAALCNGETPVEFVARWGDRYELEDITRRWH
jgi:hypothetical protein